MAHLNIPLTGHEFLLAPRWGDHPSAWVLAVAAIVALVPLGLIVWLYTFELKLISRLAATALLGLRLLLITLLLALVGLQPALAPMIPEPARQRILVLVDRTESMDVQDPQRTPLEKLRLVRALRLHTDVCSDLQLDALVAAAEAPTGDESPADRQVRETLCAKMDALSRTAIGQRLLEPAGGDLLKKLGTRFDVELMGFAGSTMTAAPDRLEDVLQWPGQPTAESKSPAVISRDFTDLGIPLKRTLELASRDRSTVRGVLLLSDGRHNRPVPPDDALGFAGRMGDQRIPLYPVMLGARQARPGISVPSLSAPPILVQDISGSDKAINATITAVVRVQNVDAGPLEVDLIGNKGVLSTVTVDHEPRGGEPGRPADYNVRFNVALNELGSQNLTVAVRPVKGVADTDLGRRNAAVAVVRDQAEVLLIDGEARWEYHYLAVALGRDPQVRQVASVVFDQPRVDRIPDAELRRINWMQRQLPPEPFAFNDQDIIVLGDVTAEQMPVKDRPADLKPELPKDDWDRLARFVKEKGGTLVIVAGKRSMPLGLLAKGTPDKPHPLAELLPIEQPRVLKSRGGFPVSLTEDGRKNPLLQLGDTGEGQPGTEDIWSKLPPHYWAVVGQKKPGATTLAYARQDDDLDTLSQKEQENRSLIAWHTVGKGRVLYVGLDSTWRWRYNVGDLYHYRFWGQLSRWAMGDKLVTGGAGAIRYGTTRTAFEPGQEVDVRLRLVGDAPKLPEKTGVNVKLVRVADGKDEETSRFTLQPRPGQPHAFDASLRDLPPGTYRIDLDIPEGSPLKEMFGKEVGPDGKRPDSPLFVVSASDSEERRDVTPDLAMLRDLAQRTRPGVEPSAVKVYTADDAGSIVDELTREDEVADVRRPLPLWESWWTLAVFVGLITVEWVGRKLAGLP